MQSEQLRTVAIVSPGDMGHSVGAVLRHNGARVITNLEGRSARSRDLAAMAEIEDVGNDAALLEQADVILSILVPARAADLADRVAGAARAARTGLLYVDCNAIAPQTTRQIGDIVNGAGLDFVDGGIIGPPPHPGSGDTRIYVSGPRADMVARLADFGLDIRVVSDIVGDASSVKMCYAALTKGLTAIATQLNIAATRLGVAEALWTEQAQSQSAQLQQMQRQLPAMVPKAYRWVGEMEEIAKTFEACGLTPKIFEGAAELYDFVARSPVATAASEDRPSGEDAFARLVSELAAAS